MCREIRYVCPAMCRGIRVSILRPVVGSLGLDERVRGWFGVPVGQPGMNGYVGNM